MEELGGVSGWSCGERVFVKGGCCWGFGVMTGGRVIEE